MSARPTRVNYLKEIPMPSLVSRLIRVFQRAIPIVGLSAAFMALVSCLFWITGRVSAQSSEEIPFYKHTIDLGQSEAAEVADVNQDGRLDIISGENWYEQTTPGKDGPRWIKHHFRDLPYVAGYLEDLGDLAIDVNGDGYPDIVTSSYWSSPLDWWENPGKSNKPWVKHEIMKGAPVEFSFLVDILNTGKPQQLLPEFGDPKYPLTWYEIVGKGSDAHWVGHVVSPRSYGHGIGAGDVNGDGLPDLVTTLAHDYGILWYEQKKDEQGNITWTKHVIDNAWSQAHALTIADLKGDGKPVLVTGKRYYAHEHDPGANEPLGVYWYDRVQTEYGLAWRRHTIDYSTRTGAGMQVCVVDIDKDGDLDIVVGGKSGLYLFENLTKGRKAPLTDVVSVAGK